MEIKIVEKSKNKVIMDIEGADHTLCNALNDELWAGGKIKSAGYKINHPLIGTPRFVVETKGDDPKKLLLDAVKKLKKKNEELKKKLVKEVK